MTKDKTLASLENFIETQRQMFSPDQELVDEVKRELHRQKVLFFVDIAVFVFWVVIASLLLWWWIYGG